MQVASPKDADGGTLPPTKTLHDEFAMAALTGILANRYFHEAAYQGNTLAAVRDSYRIADDMLAERQK